MATRPPQVTGAVAGTCTGAGLILLGVLDLLRRLNGREVREVIEEMLADQRFAGLGIDRSEAVEILRIALMVIVAICGAAIVLAVFVWRGHRGARIGLTVLGVVSSLAAVLAGFTGFVLAMLIGLTVSLLWSPPARTWFAQTTQR